MDRRTPGFVAVAAMPILLVLLVLPAGAWASVPDYDDGFYKTLNDRKTSLLPGASGQSWLPPSTLSEYFGALFSNGTRIVPLEERSYAESVVLGWGPFGGAAEYRITVAPKSSPAETTVFTTGDTRFRVPGLEPGTEYVIRIGQSADDSTQTVLKVTTEEE